MRALIVSSPRPGTWRASLVVLLALAAAACSSKEYVYEPAVNATAQVAGRPAAAYQIPPEQPRGDVRIATFGIVEIKARAPAGAEGEITVRALHLRMIVANNSDQVWTVVTREQRVALADKRESRAAYAAADQGARPPIIEIPPGGKRTIDLFFPLPPDLANESKLPEVDAIWTVHTPSEPVTQRTPFERLTLVPRPSYAYEPGWGPPYWYDPLYPYGAFPGFVEPVPSIIGQPVIVAPPAQRVR